MKRMVTTLTPEERQVLTLSARCLTNAEVAECLGMSVVRVKTLVHRASLKAGAHTRNAAFHFAMMRGEIRLDEVFSPDELAEHLRGLAPDLLIKIARDIRLGAEREILRMIDKGVLHIDKRQDTVLTKQERDVLCFVGQGLTNKEIAEELFISVSRVRNVLNRACCKLRARSRADAFMLALEQRDIKISQVFSLDEILRCVTQLKPESLEKIAQLLAEKLELESLYQEIDEQRRIESRLPSDLLGDVTAASSQKG